METESPFMAYGLLQEANARARQHDNWELDYRALEERARIEEIKLGIKAAILSAAAVFAPAIGRRLARA